MVCAHAKPILPNNSSSLIHSLYYGNSSRSFAKRRKVHFTQNWPIFSIWHWHSNQNIIENFEKKFVDPTKSPSYETPSFMIFVHRPPIAVQNFYRPTLTPEILCRPQYFQSTPFPIANDQSQRQVTGLNLSLALRPPIVTVVLRVCNKCYGEHSKKGRKKKE